MENVAEFLENIDNNLTYYEIPTQLACAYLKGHLTGRALDWNRQENWRETRGNNRYSDNSRPRREFNRFEGKDVANNRRFDDRRRGGQSNHRFHNQGGRQGGSRHGIDFMKESKLTLDFDQKSLIIPDQIKQFPKVEKPVEIDLSDAKLEVPVLQLPNFQEQFNLFTDASGVGIGAVLNRNHRPIAFASRTLNKAERIYTVTEREMFKGDMGIK
ncbi:uncharacterized protein TNCV_4242941 [Trichonephila clavipes]|nr:uncharacterized protein TNCV_4242941 [Trichonephila clavipes]